MHSVTKNCSSDLKIFANSRPSASNFKSFSRSQEQFFLTVGQNNFQNIPSLCNPWQRLSHIKKLGVSSYTLGDLTIFFHISKSSNSFTNFELLYYSSVRPKFGIGIRNRNQGWIRVMVSRIGGAITFAAQIEIALHICIALFFLLFWLLSDGRLLSKILQILGLQPRISKVFLDHKNNFFSK